MAAGLAYGVYRVTAFHPFFRPRYREWLAQTPWTSRKPLPVGPVAWVWEDGVILAGLAVLAWADGHIDPVLAATIPLLSGGVLLTTSLFATGTWGFGYATAFALGLAVWLGPNRWAFFGAAIGANLLGHIGYRRSLNRFPWPSDPSEGWWPFALMVLGVVHDQSRVLCGWPFDYLRPDLSDQPRIDLADAALISLLSGWWLFAVGSLLPPQDRMNLLTGCLLLGAGTLSVLRLGLYRSRCSPPLNFWGRIVTFRWIIPGYHQVYLGPIATLFIPLPCVNLLLRWGIPGDVAIPISFTLAMFVAFSARPSLKSWRLTGRHRILPSYQHTTAFIKVG